jgi:4-amino-4-deoxy-L-arabinose transferase-like glycosyltransferase
MSIAPAIPTIEPAPAPRPEPLARSAAAIRFFPLATVCAVCVGIFLRLVQYGSNRSLWLDEAMVANGIAARSFAELLNPLSVGLSPPGFLLGTKAAVLLFGDYEYALRLLPLLAGLASVPLFAALARRCLGQAGALFALLVFAFSPFLVYYASEVKPYSGDVLATLLVLWFALDLHEHGWSPSRAGRFMAAAMLGCLLSLTAPVVIAGSTVALALHFRARAGNDPPLARRWSAAAIAVVTGTVAGLLLMPSPGEYTRTFWQSGFMPVPPRSLAELAWYPDTLLRVFRDPLGVLSDGSTERGFYQAATGMLAFFAGASVLAAQRRAVALLLVLPIGFALLASALGVYPFGGVWTSGGRVILYLAPLFFLVMGEGLARLWKRLRGELRPVAIGLLVLLLAPSAMQGMVVVVEPQDRSEIKPTLNFVANRWQDGDVLFVQYDAAHEFRYYADKFEFAPDATVIGGCARYRPEEYLNQLAALEGSARVWIVFGPGVGAEHFDEKALALRFLDNSGRRLDERASVGSSAYLYDLGRPIAEAPRFSYHVPAFEPNLAHGCALWGGE